MVDESQRRLTRVGFQKKIEIFSGGKKIADTEMENLCIRGALVKTKDLKTGDTCRISVNLLEGEDNRQLNIEGQVVRVNETGETAIFFQEMSLETFNDLKNIIALNDGDPEKIQKEFLDYVKSRME